MSGTELPTPEQSYTAIDRPGRRLARERKARGLSLDDVASELRLAVSTLQLLEDDDYSRLPPAAFVSGYLRSYARALGLNEAEFTAGSGAARPSEPPLVVARGDPSEVQAGDPPVRFVTYVVVGGLLLLSSAWWLSQREEAPSEQEILSTAAEVPAELGTELTLDEDATETSAPEAAVATPEASAGPTDEASATVPEAPPVASTPEAPPSVAPSPPPEPVAVVAPEPEAPPPLTADMPQSQVSLELTADCWVDVTDAAGRKLAYELATAGRKMTVRGEAPFRLFFGYSPGVQVYFNGQLFDHRPFERSERARFKLGTAEDNAPLTEDQ